MSLDEARALIDADDTHRPGPLSVIVPNSTPFKAKEVDETRGGGVGNTKADPILVNDTSSRGKENDKLSVQSTSFSQNWVQDLPSYGLSDAVDLHTQTMEALRNKSKWSLVAVPLNLTGPPVDIAALSAESEKEKGRPGRKGHSNLRPASAWADGEDFLQCFRLTDQTKPSPSCSLFRFMLIHLNSLIPSPSRPYHLFLLPTPTSPLYCPHPSHLSFLHLYSLPTPTSHSCLPPLYPHTSHPPLSTLSPHTSLLSPLPRRGRGRVFILGGVCDADLEPRIPIWNPPGPRSTPHLQCFSEGSRGCPRRGK